MGGRQIGLGFSLEPQAADSGPVVTAAPRRQRPARVFAASEGEIAAHAAFMKGISDPIWGTVASG